MIKQQRPYGLWSSPVSATMIGQSVRLSEAQWDSDGRTLVWLEGRSDRGVLTAQSGAEARRDLTDEQSVRGGIGYGGGEFHVRDGVVVFAERSGRLFRRSLGYGAAKPITPPFGAAAAPAISPDGRWVMYVYSDGQTDLLGLVDAEGREWPVQLARGADFYMQPTWHPDGRQIAWVEWDHPNMPWDGTRLKLGRLEGSPLRLADQRLVDGDVQAVAVQPQFSPDGRWLSYIVSNGEWEDLVLLELQTGQRVALLHGEGFHLTTPAWVQGVRSYGWSPNSRRIYSLRNMGGRAELWAVSLDGSAERMDTGPYTWLSQLAVSPVDDTLACLASGPETPERLVVWHDGRWQVRARSTSESLSPDFMPLPTPIHWQAPDGSTVHGLYWAPRHADCEGNGVPPVMVSIHGGPTSAVNQRFSIERTYFTSRGYAWMDVNYRGSTGYGRSYQDALRGRWGEADTDDAAGAATELAAQGLGDPKKMVIIGGSAGGYTVLNALIHYPDVFKAGICNYGVTNLFDLARDTHKFELHYTDSLVGPLPEAAQRYHAWSPIFHVEGIRSALALFQGAEDKVVPPSQAEQMVAALRRRGVTVEYTLYPGEGHGFRKSETMLDYYPRVERFLQQNVLFSV